MPQSASVRPRTSDLPAAQSLGLGRYQLEAPLGRGATARVFRAREVATGRAVAIKRLTPAAGKRLISLFEREYHTLASLKHPNVIEVYDFGTSEGSLGTSVHTAATLNKSQR